MVDLYPDGSCLGNPGPGASWACIFVHDGVRHDLSGDEAQTTNNRMKMLAVIAGLQSVQPGEPVRVYSDSKHVTDGVTKHLEKWKRNGWKTGKRKRVKNVDLWLEIDRLNQVLRPEWHWISAGDGNRLNEEAHRITYERLQRCNNERQVAASYPAPDRNGPIAYANPRGIR